MMALPNPAYTFRAISALGFCAQWVVMMINGMLITMLQAAWRGVSLSGAPIKTTWTRIWPIDYVLSVLVAFFAAIDTVVGFPNIGSFLLLVDLILALTVCGVMTLVEDRRDRKTGPLRYPAFWQLMWNFCGAASVMPLYMHLFFEKRSNRNPRIEANQAQALPFTAVWSVITTLPLLLPAILGATDTQIQNGVVIWFFAPLSVGIFQELASSLVASVSYKGTRNPVIASYSIVGYASAIAHIGITVWANLFLGIPWSRMYVPNHNIVEQGPNIMADGAFLFLQYGHMFISLCVLVFGAYMVNSASSPAAKSVAGEPWANKPLLKLTAITAIAGPGAGLAWLLCTRETAVGSENTTVKQS
ncbi:hypothetical protein F4810DRAFT_663270 [Camillea tinctor]|nr:hypothetical protein F4810DRAFT_663270 [Camillea tinctor]